jgi:Ni,Fe-hydrogenase I large subunit|tara:strand:+ start:109 stop:348 length:240 start_codon:yes stop_codon:yes gene_type:complete
MQGEINTLKEKVSDYKMENKNLTNRILRLEECEYLRDDQMKVLQKVITNLMKYIEKTNNEKEDKDDQEFQILDIPKATK